MNNKKKLLICSNITLNPIDSIINEKNKFIEVQIANFDNIWIEAISSDIENIFIHCDILNISPEIRFEFNNLNYCDKIEKFLEKQLLSLKKKNLKTKKRIFFSTMTDVIFTQGVFYKNINKIVNNFNQIVTENFETINLNYIIAEIGLENSFKASNLYRFSTPYTIKFLNRLSENIIDLLLEDELVKQKVLILDCDNTIWKGVLGEDGEKNIEFNNTPIGNCFFEVQKNAINLTKNGVILCLCTKNNSEDIKKLLRKNLMPINLKNTSIIKANWDDKSENIKSISKELNLGLDSFVFIDDSEFELSEVKNKLPMVKTYSVPKDIYNYPNFFRKNITKLFNNKNFTLEDKKRVNFYRYEINRKKHLEKFEDKEKFIDSLKLRLKVSTDKQNKNYISRISQMTQKTNQFNLTTKRYTEDDIKNFINIKDFKVFTGDVRDKFGDHGKTILAIIKKEKKSFIIDTFLMSCRVIGRELEKSFFDAILNKIKKYKLPIYGTYLKTEKNEQVKDFYQKLGFNLLIKNKNSTNYILDTKKFNYKFSSRKIKIIYGK